MREHLASLARRLGGEIEVEPDEGRQLVAIRGLGQLPESAVEAGWLAAGDQEALAANQPESVEGEELLVGVGLAGGGDRQLVLSPGASGQAELRDRTGPAARSPRRAQRRTELHEALVEVARSRFGNHFLRQVPQLLRHVRATDGSLEQKQPRQDASHVAIYDGTSAAVGDRCDGAGRVASDAR